MEALLQPPENVPDLGKDKRCKETSGKKVVDPGAKVSALKRGIYLSKNLLGAILQLNVAFSVVFLKTSNLWHCSDMFVLLVFVNAYCRSLGPVHTRVG